MTKAEIIRKLAKRVGVQDLDAKIFFEVFLRKVSQQLNPGETIKIKNFGYFQMRIGKINNISASNPAPLSADLIVFYPLQNDQYESTEYLIFNIPGKKEEEYNVIDSYFSLSFGKPVIPLKDANISEYFIPPTGNELRRLFDSKADKLLQEVEVVENFTKEVEILLIDPELIDPDQMEINWDEINDKPVSPEKIISGKEPGSLNESNAFSWEFGEELEKQIEEEALLDTENEENLFVDYNDLKNISWDFGENLGGQEESIQSNEDKWISKGKESPIQDEVKKEPDEFQRVKSSISDFNIDHKNSVADDHVSTEDSDLLKSINEELNVEGFAEIKHHPHNYQFDPDIFEKSDNDIDIPEIENEGNKYDNEENIKSEPEPPPSDTIPLRTERTSGYSKRKGLGLYVIFALIIVLSGTVFLYLKFVHTYYSGSKKVADFKVSAYNAPPVIIERDYEIPVTYPYTKDSSVVSAFDPIDKSVFDQSTPPSSIVRVKDFIYKSGDKFLVQISAWSSEKNALKHASYLK
jgi:hypothetical protein